MTDRLRISVVLAVIVLVLGSCSNQRRLAKGKPLRSRTPGQLIKDNTQADFDFDYIGMKVNADVRDNGEKLSFKATLRMKRDSVIWLSIAPALGVEMARVVITPDSVKYVSKVPGQKHYYLGDFSIIQEVTGLGLDFSALQDLLVGNAVLMDKQEDKFESRIQEQQYVLISKVDRKLKKLIGSDEKDMLPNQDFYVDPLSKEYQRMLRRAKDEELTLKRFWLNGIHYRLERAELNDFSQFLDVVISFENFKEVDNQWLAHEVSLVVDDPQQAASEVTYKITRVKRNKEYDFPFTIPDDFERRFTP